MISVDNCTSNDKDGDDSSKENSSSYLEDHLDDGTNSPCSAASPVKDSSHVVDVDVHHYLGRVSKSDKKDSVIPESNHCDNVNKADENGDCLHFKLRVNRKTFSCKRNCRPNAKLTLHRRTL